MAMQYDVLAGVAATNTSTTVADGRVRVKGLVISYATGGTLTIKDGGASGSTVYSFTAPAAAGCVNILVPGEGILCETNVYVTCSNGTLATVFYG